MDVIGELLKRITAYCSRQGISEGAFGREAMNDTSFVADLRGGRSPTMRTLDKLDRFLRGMDP